jgi:hypothetical protein
MTAKQAIKARCRDDCLAGARACEFTDCALKGLAQAKGRGRDKIGDGLLRYAVYFEQAVNKEMWNEEHGSLSE